ncbi:hypothetical protein P7K49_036520 [Saguinus oedipus]|uniref:Uncharacterized protein n=1 Tax=Saguinus oedipus TaxID=9490 RepID=A0ABQ9TKC2_SAGOE|nr:hypothetical protein P7K49_036520 [Saguinus oedipus]
MAQPGKLLKEQKYDRQLSVRAGLKGAGGAIGPPSGLLSGWARPCGAREPGALASRPGPRVLREGQDPFPRHAVCDSGHAVPSAKPGR